MEFRRVLFRSLVLNDELVDLEIQLGNELQREVAGDDLGPALTVRCQLFDQASTILVAESLLVEALGQPGYASCVLAVAIDHCDNLGNVWIDRPAGERRYAIGQGPDVDHPAPAVVNQLTWEIGRAHV